MQPGPEDVQETVAGGGDHGAEGVRDASQGALALDEALCVQPGAANCFGHGITVP